MTNQRARILITGANRGLGLEMARQLAERGEQVLATCRQPQNAPALAALAAAHESLEILPLDVADADSRAALVASLAERGAALDWLLNNAAINNSGGQIDRLVEADLLEMFRVNCVAQLMLAQELLPFLRAGQAPRIIHISSGAGSLEFAARSRSNIGYSGTKAALNMYSIKQALALREDGVIVYALGPGWVRTDMGGPNADIGVEESVSGCLRVIDGLTMADSGGFGNYTGERLPW